MCFCLGDEKKTEHLLALDGANERLKLFKGNLLEEGSFEQAIEGCDAVFHTASPVSLTATDHQVYSRYISPCLDQDNACHFLSFNSKLNGNKLIYHATYVLFVGLILR